MSGIYLGEDKDCRMILSRKRLRVSKAHFRNLKNSRVAAKLSWRGLTMLIDETWVVKRGQNGLGPGGSSRLERILEIVQPLHFYRWGNWVPKRQSHTFYMCQYWIVLNNSYLPSADVLMGHCFVYLVLIAIYARK